MSDPTEREGGVWLAYNYDGSNVAPFATEIEALRYALGYSMQVIWCPYGSTLNDADNAKREGQR